MTYLPVGTKVRTKVHLATHPEGTITYILGGPSDTVVGYRGTVQEAGRTQGENLAYALTLRGTLGIPILVRHDEVEVAEDGN